MEEYIKKFTKKISECTPRILTEYFNLFIKYYQEYGPKICLLYQCGDFYELYSYTEDAGTENEITYGNANDLALALNFKLGLKDSKKPYSINSPNIVGFPLRAFEKNIDRIINAGYTAVIYKQQICLDSNGNPIQARQGKGFEYERVLSRIISASTYLPDNSEITRSGHTSEDSNNLFQIVLTDTSNYYYLSACIINLCSGKVWLNSDTVLKETGTKSLEMEVKNIKQGSKAIRDTIYRIYKSHNPVEICICTKNEDLMKLLCIEKTLEFPQNVNIFKYSSIDHKKERIEFQEEILRRSYNKKSIVSPIEHLGLTKDQDLCLALVLAIDFAYKHDTSIVRRLEKPIINFDHSKLVLEGNAIKQLDILDSSLCPQSLFKTVNFCKTCMGRRVLKERLVNPEINVETINQRYNQVEAMLNLSKDVMANIRKILRNITDISRVHRRIITGLVKYHEFSRLDRAYKEIQSLIKIILDNVSKDDPLLQIIKSHKNSAIKVLNIFNKAIEFYQKRIDLKAIDEGREHDIIRSGISGELDRCRQIYSKTDQELDKIREYLAKLVKSHCKVYKSKSTTDDLVQRRTFKEEKMEVIRLELTEARFKKIMKECPNDPILNNLETKKVSSKIRISSDKIRNLSKTLSKAKNSIEPLIELEFKNVTDQLIDRYYPCLIHIVNVVAELDVAQSTALLNTKFNYCQPKIESQKDDEEKSYIKIKQFRHPVIERLIDNIYVPNDIELGTKESKDGLLVYGLNSVGKSSLLKSVCLNIILAQAGIYVASTEFVYWPYHNIFTRLPGTDNPYLGMSSFICELMDINGIIENSNKNTFCILDEITCSTEHISGISVSGSAVNKMSKNQTSFLFATHYHELADLDIIKNLKNIGISHLEAKMGKGMGEIHFNRILRTGPSKDKQYGLEVSKNVIQDVEFLHVAEEIRLKLNNRTGLVDDKMSHFNGNLIMDHCEICNKTDTLEVHHINMQCTANDKGFIDHFHKNNIGNLVVLCWKCHHKKVHSKPAKIIINRWIDTTEGRKLEFEIKK